VVAPRAADDPDYEPFRLEPVLVPRLPGAELPPRLEEPARADPRLRARADVRARELRRSYDADIEDCLALTTDERIAHAVRRSTYTTMA
jgi:hypothetical protein